MKLLSVLLLIWSFPVLAQTTGKPHAKGAIQCKTCHTCEYPTVKEPCLIDCPRENLVTIRHSASAGPNVIQMDFFKERYGPVLFSHRLHAEMFDMAGGCGGCHHYNTTGPVLGCSECHSADDRKTDLGTPGLLAAYHRQCINCHREWSHDSGCQSCHALRSNVKEDAKAAILEMSTAKPHARVIEPLKLIYETDTEKGRLVTFYHRDHSRLFVQACSSCHRKQNCVDCHDASRSEAGKEVAVKPSADTRTEDEKHASCFGCHKNETCEFCHANEERGAFDHASRSGWALQKYHASLSCAHCHPKGQFKRDDHACASCHPAWNSNNFKHRVVGLELDENHNSLDCEDCHAKKQFQNKPSCTNCHDDKMFPKDMPGRRVK